MGKDGGIGVEQGAWMNRSVLRCRAWDGRKGGLNYAVGKQEDLRLGHGKNGVEKFDAF